MNLSSKFWQLCNQLRHDGVDSADYLEQLTYLMFLKMAAERNTILPQGCTWEDLTQEKDEYLVAKLDDILNILQQQTGLIGQIFEKPISRVDKVEGLRKMFKVLNSIQWTELNKDVIGLAFEEIIGRVANDGKKGSGQYFTPRPLIQAIVEVMRPDPIATQPFKIADVAAGTAGFLVVAYEWQRRLKREISDAAARMIQQDTYFGQELVAKPRRLALMNLYLHGVQANIKLGDSIYEPADKQLYHCILTNPPFGNKGGGDIPNRTDFRVKTADKQLNFIQHIINSLEIGGRAAVVLPDSVLSQEKATEIWRYELQNINLHTILMLPNGTFAAYAAGIKACVLFFEKGQATQKTWVYDARMEAADVTKNTRPLSYEKHFKDFVKEYGKHPNGNAHRKETKCFKCYSITQIRERQYDLSFSKLQVPPLLETPNYYLDRIIENVEVQLSQLYSLRQQFQSNKNE